MTNGHSTDTVALVAKKTKQLLDDLSRRGRYGVDTGDLGFTGTPGVVFTPRGAISACPVVVFAHDWRTKPGAYTDTFKHLASWGFVVVAPSSSSGLFANSAKFAGQVSKALDIILGARLGEGLVSAHRKRIGLVGHGMGGGVVTLLASMRTDITGVATLFPSPVQPEASERSPLIDARGLILSAEDGDYVDEAVAVASTWRGDSVYRRLDKVTEHGLVETGSLLAKFGLPGPDRKTQRAVRPLLTGWLLAAIDGNPDFDAFLDPEEKIKGTKSVSQDELIEELAQKAGEAEGGSSPANLAKTLIKG